MNTANQIIFGLCLIALGSFLVELRAHFKKKSKAETIVQIQCSTGNDEGFAFTTNFNKEDTNFEKDEKVSEAFRYVDQRREENHQKMLAIRQTAIQENEEKVKSGGKMQLKSVMEEG